MALTKVSGEIIQNPLNVGIITATRIDGNVSGDINSTGVSTFTTLKVGTGVTISGGIVTATTFSGALTGNVTGNATGLSGTPNITVGNIIASNATISGNVSVAGTLTYEDVTNVDSIGIVTARTGVRIDAGGLVVVGVTTVAAGSTAAPSITPTGDSDTGIFFPSADTIAFGEGGSEALRINSSGNVGIGLTNPNTKLDIVCGVGSTGIVVRPSSLISDANGNASAVNNMIHLRMPYGANAGAVANAGAKIGIVMEGRNDEIFQTFGGGKRASIYGVSEDDSGGYSRRMGLAFYTSPFDAAEVERIRISNTGNVGIGTTNPSEKTHISGTGDIKLRVGTTSSGVNANAALNLTTASEGNYTIQTGNAVSGGLRFYDTTAGAERVRVSAAGSFGIGTGNPDEILCVSKTSPDPYNTVLTHLKLINDAGNGGAGNRIQFVTGAATAWIQSFVAGANSTSGSDLVFGTPSTGTVGTERLRITSTGDLNITQTPGRYSVDVNPGSTSIANGGTVDFSIASGMLVANNHTNGNVTIYICGGGTVTAVANTGSNVGSFAYNSGINGYRWTNNSGSTATFGFFFVRTRANA